MTIYVGHGPDTGSALVLVCDDHRIVTGVLAHDPWYCASGHGWGSEAGPGATELARGLLIHHLGRHAWCGGCAGTGKQTITAVGPIPFDQCDVGLDVQTCNACQADRTSFPPLLVERLTLDVTSRLPATWTLTTGALDTWLRTGALL
jgi:hypothetical protein